MSPSRNRPASANYGVSNHLECAGGHEPEQELLNKIAMLKRYHARNVRALDMLRRSTPSMAWGAETQSSQPRRTTDESVKVGRELETRSAVEAPRCSPERWRTVVARVRAPARTPKSPTRVEPFRGMETSTSAWIRKMTRQREQDFRERREDEEAMARDRKRLLTAITEGTEFSGVIARSNEMLKRRQERIAEAEQDEEELRKSSAFKARPVHITDEDWHTIQERQAIRRKQRAELRKAQMASSSRLPSRMEMHARQQKLMAAAASENARLEDSSGLHTARIRARSVPPEEIREVLSRKQQRWDRVLASTKQKRRRLVPRTSPMEKRERAYAHRRQARATRELEKAAEARRREEEELLRNRQKAFSAPVPPIPRTTHSFLLKTAEVQARLKRERAAVEQEKEEEAKRRIRERETSRALAEVMKEANHQRGTQPRRDSSRHMQLRARESRQKYRQALRENKATLENAMAYRPTLWERHDAEIRKQEAKRSALSAVAERVFNTGSEDDSGARWTREAASKMLDEEEKAVLGIFSQ